VKLYGNKILRWRSGPNRSREIITKWQLRKLYSSAHVIKMTQLKTWAGHTARMWKVKLRRPKWFWLGKSNFKRALSVCKRICEDNTDRVIWISLSSVSLRTLFTLNTPIANLWTEIYRDFFNFS
jgi:hypothetical protein